MFNAKYEDPESGRAWQGVIKYTIGAQLENTGMPSEHRLLVSTDNHDVTMIVWSPLPGRNTSSDLEFYQIH